jgi:hypothetical protein
MLDRSEQEQRAHAHLSVARRMLGVIVRLIFVVGGLMLMAVQAPAQQALECDGHSVLKWDRKKNRFGWEPDPLEQ